MSTGISILRVYDDPGRKRGEYRVLVDRLWPRGKAKGSVDLDEWLKDVAPSATLRQWYGHVPERFSDFSRRYEAELGQPPASEAVSNLRLVARNKRLTLLTATKDVDHSGARVLAHVLERQRP